MLQPLSECLKVVSSLQLLPKIPTRSREEGARDVGRWWKTGDPTEVPRERRRESKTRTIQ